MSKSAQKAIDEANRRADAMALEAEARAIPNVHPADELSAVREEIKILTKRENELRDWLLAAPSALLRGDTYTANITPGVRETLDRKALTEAYGEAAIAPFIKSTPFKTVKLVEN